MSFSREANISASTIDASQSLNGAEWMMMSSISDLGCMSTDSELLSHSCSTYQNHYCGIPLMGPRTD